MWNPISRCGLAGGVASSRMASNSVRIPICIGIRWASLLSPHAIRHAGFLDVESDFPVWPGGRGGEFADGVEQRADSDLYWNSLGIATFSSRDKARWLP